MNKPKISSKIDKNGNWILAVKCINKSIWKNIIKIYKKYRKEENKPLLKIDEITVTPNQFKEGIALVIKNKEWRLQKIKIKAEPGEVLERAISKAMNLFELCNFPIQLIFNKIRIDITEKDTLENLEKIYCDKVKKKEGAMKKICKNCKWYILAECENEITSAYARVGVACPALFCPDETFGCNQWEGKDND